MYFNFITSIKNGSIFTLHLIYFLIRQGILNVNK
uniref:Uncharacterized protein n=1 Tax=Lepeophtheirus salmonis TaxID=72036 RepID=A0A0K2UZV7_LEPSM